MTTLHQGWKRAEIFYFHLKAWKHLAEGKGQGHVILEQGRDVPSCTRGNKTGARGWALAEGFGVVCRMKWWHSHPGKPSQCNPPELLEHGNMAQPESQSPGGDIAQRI